MRVPHDRLRKVAIPNATFDRLIAAAGGLPGIAAYVGRQMGVADLEVDAFKPDGIQWIVFFDSSTFAVEKCQCRANAWPEFSLTV